MRPFRILDVNLFPANSWSWSSYGAVIVTVVILACCDHNKQTLARFGRDMI